MTRWVKHNPYEAPTSVASARVPTVGTNAEYGGVEYVVSTRDELPRVCLKCAATDDVVRRPERLIIRRKWLQFAIGALSMLAVLSFGSFGTFTRNRALFVGALIIVGVANRLSQRHVDLSLPLCVACDAAWSRSRIALYLASALSLVGVLSAMIAIHEFADYLTWTVGGILPFVGLLPAIGLGSWANKRLLAAKDVTDDRVRLTGVSWMAIEKIAEAKEKANRSMS